MYKRRPQFPSTSCDGRAAPRCNHTAAECEHLHATRRRVVGGHGHWRPVPDARAVHALVRHAHVDVRGHVAGGACAARPRRLAEELVRQARARARRRERRLHHREVRMRQGGGRERRCCGGGGDGSVGRTVAVAVAGASAMRVRVVPGGVLQGAARIQERRDRRRRRGRGRRRGEARRRRQSGRHRRRREN